MANYDTVTVTGTATTTSAAQTIYIFENNVGVLTLLWHYDQRNPAALQAPSKYNGW